MNDEHDNAADDKAMLARVRGKVTEAKPFDEAEGLRTKTGRLITRADLDQWALEAERFEPSDDDYVNWREAADYYDDGADPGDE